MLDIDPYTIPLEEINVSDPRLYQNNTIGPYFERLRAECPVHFCAKSEYEPFWSITKYDDIVAINSADKLFSCDYELGGHILGYQKLFRCHGVDARMFQSTDAPKHTGQRKALAPVVARASVKEMEEMFRELCAAILDNLPVGETFNWVDFFSIELTTQVLAKLFDFPWEERRLLTRWSDVAVTEPGFGIVNSWEERSEELGSCFQKFATLWHDRVNAGPAGDLLSMMVFSEATKDLSPEEFLGNLINVIVGGNDTTRNSLTGGVVALNQCPDQYEKLRENPDLIDSMVPEIIRWQTPISHMARTALDDYEIGGKTIRAGERLALWYISGNRDEEVIKDPESFVLDRENARQHLSFGFGAHHCLGYRVAELQLKVAWQEIMKRFRFVEVVGEPKRVCSNVIHGYKELPVCLHPW
ncbi:MAG: cytochrome P450 [Proteobacteria bacterium]|nr:cytochrome P450 [Pseudomonadota bacterium]MBT6674613.1 cytochrome P450 [Pseudomonadota bacterium]